MRQPRFLHHLYARMFGYFWLPCPICGEHFGGHEYNRYVYLMTSSIEGKCICNKEECAIKAQKLNTAILTKGA